MGLTRETAPPRRAWLRAHAIGLASFLVGVVAIAVAAWMQFGGSLSVTEVPDARFTVPAMVVAVALGVASLVRREGALPLPIAGIGLGAAALAPGWVIVVAAVAAVAGLLIAALAHAF
jgi:hypothetical protein